MSVAAMRINFLVHDFSKAQPGGGPKVEYEYANRMAALHHDVVIYHSLNFDRDMWRSPRCIVGAVRHNLAGPRAVKWFQLDPRVRCRYLPRVVPALLRPVEVTIFDSFAMAECIPRPTARTGVLLHVVYEFPVWHTGEDSLRARLVRSLQRADIGHIATSAAVEGMLGACGTTALATITCGIDLPEVAAIPPTGTRAPLVGFALRPEPYKGIDDILAAMPRIRAACPAVTFEAFGRYPAPDQLPVDLVNHGYLDDQQLRAFYQRLRVFVSASHAEGWGLTVAEAMANGAAVVVATNGGSADFAIHGDTAVEVPVAQPDLLAKATLTLLEDEALRTLIVGRGIDRSREMSWDRSAQALDALLGEVVGATPR